MIERGLFREKREDQLMRAAVLEIGAALHVIVPQQYIRNEYTAERWNAAADTLGLPKRTEPVRSNDGEVVHAIFDVLQMVNPHVSLSEVDQGGFAGCEGEVIANTPAYIIQHETAGCDQRTLNMTAPIIALLRTEMEQLRTPASRCKVHVRTHPTGVVVARFDPGAHKECVIAVPTHTEYVYLFAHTPSSYEKTVPGSVRTQFIDKMFSKHWNRSWSDVHGGVFGVSHYGERVARLAVAVKDLDMNLRPEDMTVAGYWFDQRAVNLSHMLTMKGHVQKEDGDRYVTRHEQLLLAEYRADLQEQEERVREAKRYIDRIHVAREHNYAALNTLQEFSRLTSAVLNQDIIRRRVTQSAKHLFRKLQQQVLAFAHAVRECAHATDAVTDAEVEYLFTLFQDVPEALDAFAHAGDSMPSEVHAYKSMRAHRIRELSPYPPTSWNGVTSINEAIRFLHTQLYQRPAGLAQMITQFESPEQVRRVLPEWQRYTMVDLSARGFRTTAPGRIFHAVVDEISSAQHPMGRINFEPTAILSEEYAEWSFPTGKHRIDISAQYAPGQHSEYSCAIRFFESGYPGSRERRQMCEEILHRAGFRIHDVAHIEARMFTRDEQTWERALHSLLRLPYVLSDVDLVPLATRHGAQLFEEGVNQIGFLTNSFVEVQKAVASHVSDSFLRSDAFEEVILIARRGTRSELAYLGRLLRSLEFTQSCTQEQCLSAAPPDCQPILRTLLKKASKS